MKTKKIKNRLQLLNNGRAHYLEFLRNLTPQVILFSISLILMGNIDFTKLDLNNWYRTVSFFFLFGSFVLAFYANSTLFYERCFSQFVKWRSNFLKLLTKKNLTGRRRLFAKLYVLWNCKLIEVLEIFVVFWFFHFALAIVVIMSLTSAKGIWNAVYHLS